MVATPGAFAQGYTAVDLGTLGGADASATGINDSGEVVGYSERADGSTEAFAYSNGTMTPLGTLGGTNSYATAINDAGTIVGWSNEVGDGSSDAFSFSQGKISDLGTMGGTASYALGINNSGTVVGYYDLAATVPNSTLPEHYSHAFSWTGGQSTDLGTLGGTPHDSSYAYAINASGQIAGYSTTNSPAVPGSTTGFLDAFRYMNGTLTDLGTIGGALSLAFGINASGTVVGSVTDASNNQFAAAFKDGAITVLGSLGGDAGAAAQAINGAGEIVGVATVPGGGDHAFVFLNGQMIDLNTLDPIPGVELVDATAINDHGQIVAVGDNGHSYLLTAIPEASDYACLMGAVILAGVVALRRRFLVGCAA